MEGENYDWSQFEINYYYPVPLQAVFAAWSTNQGLKSFFIEKIQVESADGSKRSETTTYREGDKYAWAWRHDCALSGSFIKVVKNSLMEFSFGSMTVTLKFKQLSDATLLQLVQTNIPTNDLGRATSHLNCRLCWTFFLTNLKSVLCHSIDLRDTNPLRASSFEVGYVAKEIEIA